MAGINYNLNSLSQREKLSFSPKKTAEICESVCKEKNVYGCIIISTCNRTEIYISCSSSENPDPSKLLLKHSGVLNFDGNFEKNDDIGTIYHIIELACGLKSQIMGEEQIVGQINSALRLCKEHNCTDSILNTLFRTAVSAGKYKLSHTKLSNIPISSAYGAVELLEKLNKKNLVGKKCIVIGNGKMGQIVQKLLIKKGCKVFVTLRGYKHGNNDIIKGCNGIKFKERYNFIDGSDFVISATKSPHYTISYDKFSAVVKKPKVIIDLALPRDVEPKISEICSCYNIDELGFETKINPKDLKNVQNIIEKFVGDFIKWRNYKFSLQSIASVKDIISKRIVKSSIHSDNFIENTPNEIIEKIVDKTVNILLGGIKDSISPNIMKKCEEKIKERGRL